MTSIDKSETTFGKIIESFFKFHQTIIDYDKSSMSVTEKWNKISTYMHENNDIVVKVYNSIKKKDIRHDIKLDYSISQSQLQKKISSESENVVKASTIILSIHHIIYDLMQQEGNYTLVMDGKKEMSILNKKIMYYVNLSAKNEQNVYFHAFILTYALESLFNKHFYIGIDYEFTNKKIQLVQLNFEHNIALQSIIMMVSPNELEPVMTDNFINLIICNKYIKKILHGSDSLDIPYMYTQLLNNDEHKIFRFTRTLIDTRFLCEYYKLTREQDSDNKCSIYDEDSSRSAIYYFHVISTEQQERLAELLDSRPAPHDIAWNIHKLPQSQILYAMYDVIYLKYFYYKMINVATQDEQTDLGKKSVIELYKYVLNEITRFVYLERNNLTFLMTACKTQVDPLNNYYIKQKDGQLKMIDIYNKISVNLSTVNPVVNVDKMTKVNHFRTPVMTIIKRLVYGHISQWCRVYKDKTSMWTDKLYNTFIFDFLNKMEYKYLSKMFNELNIILESRVRLICPK